ncbi:MAG: O-acetyl-ADP-ribose deacetylase [Micrococcales bacterium]|nr:O-acetyl-ADP-ribose deacetylase [Micrococcales bacterium]
MQFVLGDITTIAVDAVVNAANEALSDGAGVNGAIHRAAGPKLPAACRAVAPCPTGEARITPGFDLPARFIIHTVGPVWRGGQHDEARLLASAYRSSIRLAEENGLHSIAFPAISCGIFGYPVEAAARIAVDTVREATAGASIDVTFVLFSHDLLEVFRAA